MSKPIFIIGHGGLAKEVAQLIRQIDPQGETWFRISYVTYDKQFLGVKLPFGSIDYLDADLFNWSSEQQVDLVIGIGTPELRKKYFNMFRAQKAFSWPNLIHPSCEIDLSVVTVGRGNIFTKGVVVTCDILIGDANLFNLNVTIGHDCQIGSFNVINPGANVSGGVMLGDECLIGTGSQILQRLKVTSSVIVGAGAVVTKDLLEPGTYMGMPAKKKI